MGEELKGGMEEESEEEEIGRVMGKGGEKIGWRVGFWNVAGLRNKDRNFWEVIKE